ncbi:MAG: hypothetical protein ACRD38_02180 [Nitrososphaerales archaeon]
MNYKALYGKVMRVSPKIRFATICNMNGKIMYSGHRKGVKNLLNPKESRMSLQQAVKIWKMRNKLAPKIGRGKYVLAEYARIKRITVPLGKNYLLYVSTAPSANHANIINRIRKLTARSR